MADRRKPFQKRRGLNRRRQVRYYAAIFSVLALLIAAAFFAPQILFQVQDAILCRDTVLTQQESLNVDTLSTTYEKSLEKRMQNFAEGLGEGDTFYTTSQSLALTSEVREYVYSDRGLFSNVVNEFAENGLLPWYIWEGDYTILRWKQYVIYSDDFAKGVNFILWYVEMQDPNGVIVKLLADAEDGTIYAIRTESNRYDDSTESADVSIEGRNYIDEIYWSDRGPIQIWGTLAYCYECLDDSEIKDFHIMVDEYGWTGNSMNSAANGESYGYDADKPAAREAMDKEMLAFHEEWGALQEKVRYYRDGNDAMGFQLTYGEARLDVLLTIPPMDDKSVYVYGYPDIRIGIRQIYEMIPEFS
nr:hypothetical protein [uncultured Acetatifactor sp.]